MKAKGAGIKCRKETFFFSSSSSSSVFCYLVTGMVVGIDEGKLNLQSKIRAKMAYLIGFHYYTLYSTPSAHSNTHSVFLCFFTHQHEVSSFRKPFTTSSLWF